MVIHFRTAYNYDTDAASLESGISFEDSPSLTKQSFAEEADINEVVRRFGLTGQLPPISGPPPQYGDFEGIFDYQSALNTVIAAQQSFAELPAHVRARFHNDPAAFVDYASNPENVQGLIEMGLAYPVEADEPVPVEAESSAS